MSIIDRDKREEKQTLAQCKLLLYRKAKNQSMVFIICIVSISH